MPPIYYVQIVSDALSELEAYWKVENTVAERIDVMSSELNIHHAKAGEGVIDTLSKRFPATQFHKLFLGPGEYHPRMARPGRVDHEASPGYNPDCSAEARNARTTSTGQLHALIGELEQLCRVVHPVEANFAAFGHEIRNLLIIACTEVEAHWKNILKENGARGRSTADYVKLAVPMRLGEYGVALSWYPWLPLIFPFKGWAPSKTPTKMLEWYKAYNNVKHDRETNFAQATLINALKAVTGCFVMLCAQYGWNFALQGDAGERAFFRLVETPRWQPSDIYVPPYGAPLRARPFPF